MTITIPNETESNLLTIVNARSLSVDQLVQEIIHQYLADNAALADDLIAWQDIRDEAIETVEKSFLGKRSSLRS